MLLAAHVLAHLKRLLASVANAKPTFNARGWFRQLQYIPACFGAHNSEATYNCFRKTL